MTQQFQFCETTCEIPPGGSGRVALLSFDEATSGHVRGETVAVQNPWDEPIEAGRQAFLTYENDTPYLILWETN